MIRARAACGIGLLATSLVLATARPAAAFVAAPDATALAVEADAAHDAGRVQEAAALYVRAYRAMSPDEKKVLGEVIVVAAVEDLRASFDTKPDPAHPRLAGELLDEYERDTAAALPATLAAHREWVETTRASTDASDDTIVIDEPEPPRDDPRPEPRPRKHRAIAPVTIGVGLAAAIGGAAMIGFGAPLGRRAESARRDAFADERFLALPPADPGTIAYVAGWDAYVRHEQRRTTALAAVGSILIAAGIGVAIYGVTRLVRQRRAAATR